MATSPADLLGESLAALAGVEATDVEALARVGASALVAGRAELACKVFRGLSALEPAVAAHRLHLAAAERAQGNLAGALAALDSVIADTAAEDGVKVHALLLRAELVARTDRAAAKGDLARARDLAARSPAAKKAWEQGA